MASRTDLGGGEARPLIVHVTAAPISLWSFFRDQCKVMQGRGFDVRAISSPGPFLDRFAEATGICVKAIAMSREIAPLRDLVTIRALARAFSQWRPAIVHAHMSKAGLLAMIAARLSGVPHPLYHNHGMAVLSTKGAQRILLAGAEAVTCRLASRVYTVSPTIQKHAEQSGICPRGKMKVFGNGSINGVDAEGEFSPANVTDARRNALRERLGIPPDVPVVAFVGRICRLKGLAELLAAWAVVRDRFPSAHLVLAGEVDDRDPLPAAATTLMKGDARIHITGWIDDTAAVYANADVFVLPSRHEGLPVTLLEAAAMKLPSVATAIPGNIDVVSDGLTGRLVPVRRFGPLASAICEYLGNPALRANHGHAARARVLRDFRPMQVWDEMAAEYRRITQQPIDRPHPQPRQRRSVQSVFDAFDVYDSPMDWKDSTFGETGR
jgi:glycosyltransferase involved in cell wall biosynthesis